MPTPPLVLALAMPLVLVLMLVLPSKPLLKLPLVSPLLLLPSLL